MMEDFLNIYKKKISDIGQDSKGKIIDNTQKLQSSVKEKIDETARTKAQIISKIITKYYVTNHQDPKGLVFHQVQNAWFS